MFRCERCGSGFTPREAKGVEACPRCQGRDGVRAPLAFKPFYGVGPTPTTLERVRRTARGLRTAPGVPRGAGR
jgi:hypothetical protein